MAKTLIIIVLGFFLLPLQAGAYDPLNADTSRVQTQEFTVNDQKRNRDIPIKIYFPPRHDAAPVVLFSHGLGGSNEGNTYLGNHWASRGYVVVFVQHLGSDSAVWKDQSRENRMNAMKQAATRQNLLLRVRDINAVLDQLGIWNKAPAGRLFGKLDMSRVGMSGHSFGAVTTEAVSGETYPGRGQAMTDTRIRAAIMFSPSSPRRFDASIAFSSVKIPWMLMTGTRDTAPIGATDVASRLNVYPHLPQGHKYEVVLNGAQHSAFTERSLPADAAPRNPNHHRVILALSTAFWDAYLSQDSQAQAWLDGSGPSSILEDKDTWYHK